MAATYQTELVLTAWASPISFKGRPAHRLDLDLLARMTTALQVQGQIELGVALLLSVLGDISELKVEAMAHCLA